MHNRLRALAVFGTGLLALSGCDAVVASTYEDDAALPSKITSVRLDDIGSGSVTVHGGAGTPAVHRKLTYRGDRPDGPTHQVVGGVLHLRGCGSHCSAAYTVEVPAGLPVSGTASNGSIELTRVGGVDVRTSSGAIRLDDVTGTVKARTSNGRIEGRALKGADIEARTSNGGIELAVAKPQNVRATTSNGAIDLTVPQARYRVAAHTSNGHRSVRIADDPSAGLHLDLTTSNGAITAAFA
ncbi:DUF4097 family beta strand repeat-containing protein [Actinomadura verrucosospora]|uniref:Lipoprotein n=1 Tax=Actinomadura verrucosospora TaxID=46165 RepID=A0A7D3VXS4_ACTVE|nr:DUF4097 family beta strand repeat-containing protein [Actinomadura verrucosospora]QKG23554.1 lipoprotein [Actinomadura verrucosospora]